MSAEATPPLEEWVPNPNEPEVDRFRREDPDFPILLAKARARARGQDYNPERHGPFATNLTPRKQRAERIAKASLITGDLEGIMARFREKGAANGRHLKAVPTTRLDEVNQR